MIEDITGCYRILDLEPEATLAEVKSSYRELVKVWHPDRFPNDPKFQKKGAEKLKQINAAYERICHNDATQASRSSASTEATTPQANKPAHAADSASSSDSRNHSEREKHSQPPRSSPKSTPPQSQHRGRKFIQIALVIGIFFVMKSLFTTGDSNRKLTKDFSSPPVTQQPKIIKPLANNIRHTLREHTTTDSRQESPKVQPKSPKREPDSVNSGNAPLNFESSIPPNPHTQILEHSGAPLKLESNIPALQPLKKQEKLGPIFDTRYPKSTPDSGGRFFTVGSTKDEVIAVRGAPNKSSETEFYYESGGKVFFEQERVVGWDCDYYMAVTPFGAKLLPSSKVEPKEFFTLGSTKDEVLSVQGTPTKLTDTRFNYYTDSVGFMNGKVVSWNQNKYATLRAKLEPSAPVVSKKDFALDSTKDEVLALQGTPTSILIGLQSTGDSSKIEFADTIFRFGVSAVYFKDGRVISWKGYSLKTRGPGRISD